MIDYQSTYCRMSDDQLMTLAQEVETLVPGARGALNSELARRKLGPKEIEKQAEYVRKIRIEEARRKPLTQTFNGFGTELYGKRNVESDGSFLTTKWFVFFFIPVIPLRSFRVRYVGPGKTTILPGWSRKYLILAEFQPDVRQVVNVYAFLASYFIGFGILRSTHSGSLANWVALAVWACAPWIVRTLARQT